MFPPIFFYYNTLYLPVRDVGLSHCKKFDSSILWLNITPHPCQFSYGLGDALDFSLLLFVFKILKISGSSVSSIYLRIFFSIFFAMKILVIL